MDPILKKMNFKAGMKIGVWNVPTDLESLIETWRKEGWMAGSNEKPNFLLAFVETEEEVGKIFPQLHSLSPEDEILWMAYPKGTSKKYKAQINRDSGWKKVGELDYEVVRQIAIDADWSALRFRKVKFIKTMTRKFSTKDQ
ncbi:hypothetical protein D0X99_05680 [Algoriphagus lacus]|uniref:DUF3052 family protein n=1 Tax=Algoriphagus lacus TaxID=2056311 RepID=A0A418PVI3_9BACT|nr:hypothetical protein [Algoriphagus lacus]RIW17529.1 hypothetical protein D0X99_05680 [Algoriphagus lacus]